MTVRLVPAVACATLVLAACGQGFTREVAIDSFGEANPDATPDQSACVVDLLIDQYGLEQLEVELATDPLDANFEEAQFRAMFRCGIEGDVTQQLTVQLTDAGVDRADAPCVAEALVESLTDADIDVLLSGQLTDEFSTKFFQAMDDCGALNPDPPPGVRS